MGVNLMRLIIYKMEFDNILTNLNTIYLILSEAAKVSTLVTQKKRTNMNIIILGQGESAVHKDACRQG